MVRILLLLGGVVPVKEEVVPIPKPAAVPAATSAKKTTTTPEMTAAPMVGCITSL